MAAVAANKKIDLENREAHVHFRSAGRNKKAAEFHVKLDIHGGVTRRERMILFNASKSCDISKMLDGHIEIKYQALFVSE